MSYLKAMLYFTHNLLDSAQEFLTCVARLDEHEKISGPKLFEEELV